MEHPLQLWLDRRGMSVVEFASKADVSYNRVYVLLSGRGKAPLASTLVKIQTATGGEVSVVEMLRWLDNKQGAETA